MRYRWVLVLLLIPALLFGQWIGQALANPDAPQAVPGLVNYQGYLTNTGGQPFTGPASLTFALYDAAQGGNSLWNETQPGVAVANGYFSVMLGSVNPFSAGLFAGPERYLQVSVDTGGGPVDLPRQRLGTVPFALVAEQAASAPWSGLSGVPAGFADGSDDGGPYAQMVTVAKSGAQFTSVQAAIDSISDASFSKRYLVWIGPGEYNEQVTLKSYIDLQGSGTDVTLISASGFSANTTGTLIGAENTEVRFLQIRNIGGNNYAVPFYSNNSAMRLMHVKLRGQGATSANYGAIVTAFQPKFYDVEISVFCTGGVNCIGISSAGSPLLRRSSINVNQTGTGFSYGINSIGSAMDLDDVEIEVTGPPSALANNLFGILQQGGTPSIRNVKITAAGLNNTYGYYQTGGLPVIRSSFIEAASGAGQRIGIYFSGGPTTLLRLSDSEVRAATNTLMNAGVSSAVGVYSTYLHGGPVSNQGTLVCAGVTDEDFTFYANTCP